jgi:acyl carrier protein
MASEGYVSEIQTSGHNDAVDTVVRNVLRDILGLSQEQVAGFDRDTELFGALPELDSMAVAGLLTEMEDRLDILIEDDEVDGELFENFGNLVDFARAKTGA